MAPIKLGSYHRGLSIAVQIVYKKLHAKIIFPANASLPEFASGMAVQQSLYLQNVVWIIMN